MAGTNDIKKGLPLIGKEILTEYITMSGSQADSAVLHSCSNCSTRELPAVPVDEPIIKDTLHLRLARHRALCFTTAITQDIKAANEAGLIPTLLSVGLDGWVCNERKLLPWLQASELEFNLVLRLNGLHFGMSDKFVKQNANSYCVRYNMNDIQRALENGPGLDEKTDELIACWKLCQAGKDNSFGVNVGRNTVNMKKSEN
ncbi:hypothetical protein N0V94_000227 [Neodidymelliopsis sp. IMI 364377]|nr:hypothetical protein N0V94_000227 [Neodidymelliopsis sp. IMI 364377]